MDRERVESVVRNLEIVLEELAADGRERVEAAEKAGREEAARYNVIRQELPALDERVRDLRAELERLPIDHSRAVLADDPDEQARIKVRNGHIHAELEALEDCRVALEAELRELTPRPSSPPHPRDADVHRLSRTADENVEVLVELERLRERVVAALKAAESPFALRAGQLQGRIDDLNRQISADVARQRRGTAPARR